MKRISLFVMLAVLIWARPTEAVPILNILPPGGSATGAPGETVGWGYEIINDDLDHWLVVGGLIADGFQFGSGSDLIFDFPILAPGASLVRTYIPGTQGLFEFTWDLTAPVGFVNAGVFHIAAELWAGDPFAGGQFASALPDLIAAYDVTATEPTASVPEPATLWMLSAGLGLAGLSRFAGRRGSRRSFRSDQPRQGCSV